MRPTAGSPSAPPSAPTTPRAARAATNGQTAGSVFVSGAFGTLTFGDTNGADEQWVGDVPGDYSLTGLGDLDETLFVSNGGDFGADSGSNFAATRSPVRRSATTSTSWASASRLSSNRDLTDIAVGAGYSADFGGGSWTAGIGYNNFDDVRHDEPEAS